MTNISSATKNDGKIAANNICMLDEDLNQLNCSVLNHKKIYTEFNMNRFLLYNYIHTTNTTKVILELIEAIEEFFE